MKFRCKCGTIYETLWYQLYTDNKDICNKCAWDIGFNKRRHTIDMVKNILLEYGYILTSTVYNNVQDRLSCADKNGYMYTTTINDFTSGARPQKFSVYNPYTINNISTYLKDKKVPCKILSTKYKDVNTPLEFLCDCGNKYKALFRSVFRYETYQCQKCSKKQSKLEIKVDAFLDKLNISYGLQYPIPDNIRFKFDFYIKINNKFLLLEADGRQHYEFVKLYHVNQDGFLRQQERDEYKNKYCEDNNIPLLRIPYWEFKDDVYKKSIDDFISNIG